MSLFPFVDNIPATVETVTQALSMFYEYAWDFDKNDFILIDGKPVILQGNEALKVWIYHALKTERYRFAAYSWNYGNEIESLRSHVYASADFRKAENERYIKECLLINPYIKSIENIEINAYDDDLNISFTVTTIYGEETINV